VSAATSAAEVRPLVSDVFVCVSESWPCRGSVGVNLSGQAMQLSTNISSGGVSAGFSAGSSSSQPEAMRSMRPAPGPGQAPLAAPAPVSAMAAPAPLALAAAAGDLKGIEIPLSETTGEHFALLKSEIQRHDCSGSRFAVGPGRSYDLPTQAPDPRFYLLHEGDVTGTVDDRDDFEEFSMPM
jgi:hypothetical protein